MKIALTYRSATRLNMTAATRVIPNDILSPFERAAWSGNASTSAGAIAVGQAPLVGIWTSMRGMWR